MLALAVMAGVGATLAQAAPASHIFDPELSVTGGCTTNEDDLVADPGCPYPLPPGGPSESFISPSGTGMGIATDSYGDVYVTVPGAEDEEGKREKAHIDVFDPEGFFITELAVSGEPKTVAVDSKGYLYVYFPGKLVRYDFSVYKPLAGEHGEISYKPTPSAPLSESNGFDYASLAVNPANDHLFVNYGDQAAGCCRWAVVEYGSGEEENPLLDPEVAKVNHHASSSSGLAIDKKGGRLYYTDQEPEIFPTTGIRLIRVVELEAPHNEIEPPFAGSSLPEGTFVKCGGTIESCARGISLAVDESTGNIFVYDNEKKKVIYELTEKGQYLSTIKKVHLSSNSVSGIAVDNGKESPNGKLNSEGRYLWVTDSPPGVSHAYTFKPTHVTLPEVESVSVGEVSQDEALLEATINSGQAETSYTFEYLSKQQFEESGFEGAKVAGEGAIPAGTLPVSVSAEATGLSPGVRYVFRAVAENELSPPKGEAEGEFKTYSAIALGPCPNDAVRTRPSSALPDCRAYELVTPPDTGGRPPLGLGGQGLSFPAPLTSPAGDRVFFRIENGLIPGFDVTASLPGDPYLATRGADGWGTVATGGKGTEATGVAPGGRSPDQTYSAWAAEGLGPAVIGGKTVYARYPDGHSELFGGGSLGVDPHAVPELISEGGGHMVFFIQNKEAGAGHPGPAIQLEPNAPPEGTAAIYDRTSNGVTHVISLLPEDKTPEPGENASYVGVSLDGRGVAFRIGSKLYLRYADQKTLEIGEGLTFEGIAEGGKRLFYLENGSLYALDVEGGKIPFATSGNVTVVNISADGTTAYFISPSKLTGNNTNPLGEKATLGKENLYQTREGSIRFVGTVSKEDVIGEGPGVRHNALGLWVNAVHGAGNNNPGGFAIDPSRTTGSGGVLLFQSNVDLTAYKSGGARQIYRYDSAATELACLSCNPTGATPAGDALLQNVAEDASFPEPSGPWDTVQNLSASGRRAFFQTPDPLVAADTDGLQDVYEWEAQSVGSCTDPGGCLYLISSGRSEKVNYLYAASESGDDVFFRSSDLLAPADKEAIPSIYDARVGGGFPVPPEAGECEGEGCRPQLTPIPPLPTPGSAAGKSGNVSPKCPKGKRRVKRHGKVRCVKKKKHHRQKRPTGTGKKGRTK